MRNLKQTIIKYFKSLGIEVYTNTKARGHQGFFLNGRIDISKNTKEERVIPTLLHEFAHYIHNKIEPEMPKTGGKINIIFDCNEKDKISIIEKELLGITGFVDQNSHLIKFKEHKAQIKKKIKVQEEIIKQDYPKFMRSKKFKEFDKYIKKSKARYLLRYDRVKFVSPNLFGLFKKIEFFAIENLERDFPEMPKAFCAYIRLKSAQKKQSRISARINKLNKYYEKPAELFARFVECAYIDKAQALALAPYSTQRFFQLLEAGYYLELREVFKILQNDLALANY